MDASTVPSRRVIVLGASNVRRGMSACLRAAEAHWPGQVLDVMFAMGHGRSYGQSSWVLGRTLPSILACGLWEALAERPALPTHALVTDIGNDLVYGHEPDRIIRWVETCLERLGRYSDRVTVSRLPVENIVALRGWQFLAFRTVLFPFSRLILHDAIRHVHVLNDWISALAERYPVDVVVPRREWYGTDPIHIRRRRQDDAWRLILAPWPALGEIDLAPGSFGHWWRLHRMRPQYRRMFGVEQRADQPAGKFPGNSIVSMY